MLLPGKRPVLPPLDQRNSPNHYEGRSGAKIIKVVVHVTVGGYAGAVQWMLNPKSQVAAHVCLSEDGSRATQLVAYGNSAWHAMHANNFSLGLEMAGYPDKESDKQLGVAARIVAFWLHKNNIPARYAPEFNLPGFCRHGDLGVDGGGHFGCPMTQDHFIHRFVPLVMKEVDRGGFLQHWGG